MMAKLKNDEKSKQKPKRMWMTILLAGVALLAMIIVLTVLLIGQMRESLVPDFAYTTRCGIHLYDLDTGSTTYQIPDECTLILDFDFSPDGQQVAYLNNEGEVILAQVEPYIIEEMISTVTDVTALDWSPDGDYIAMWQGTGLPTGQQLLIYETATGELIDHGMYSMRYTSLSWSPNSRELIFASDHGSDMELVHYNTLTGEITALTDDAYLNRHAVWAGHHVIYARYDYDNFRDALWMLNLGTGESHELIAATSAIVSASADGRYLAYMAVDDEGYPALFWMDMETGENEQLTPYEPQPYRPRWLIASDFGQ